jgi:hypothetical protein
MLCVLVLATAAAADEADAFFDDSEVREVRLTFTGSNWYDVLYQSHDRDPDDP